MKKLGSLFAIVVMIMLFAFSASALEPTGQCGENAYWTFDESTGELAISGSGRIESGIFSKEHGIVSVVISDNVTSIDSGAFYWCKNISTVTLSKNITEIENEVFHGCLNLKYIELPYGIKRIGDFAFKDCMQLNSVTIPEGVEYIGYRAFFGCDNLEYVNISEGVTYMEAEVFCNCPNIKSVSFPKSLVTLNAQGFSYYEKLTDVYYAGNKTQWEKIDGINYEFGEKTDLRIHYNSNYLTHPFTSTVTVPNCTDKGFTKHSCDCGYSYNSDYVDALAHKYSSEITTPVTHLTDGVETFTCVCGDTYIKTIDKLKDHTYKGIITNPTCTTQGFTTYICECGDSYKDKFVNALGHNMGEFIVVKEASCTAKGEERADCSRCDYFNIKKIDLKQHIDENGDENCDACELYLPSLDCLCVCHAKTIGAFVYKLFSVLDNIFGTRLLEKVFNISEYCTCGLKH